MPQTLRRNEAAFDEYRFRQLCLTGVTAPKLAKRFAGTDLSMPFALAPTGMTALSHWSGDIACAQAAEAAGIRYTLSGACSYSPEEVAAATKEKHWFQLYCFGDRDTVGKLIERAQSAGYTALFLTVDVPVRGHRESETRTGFAEFARRHGDYAMAGLAATARAAGKTLSDVRLVFFGVGTTPVRACGAEAALANGDVEAAAKALAKDLDPPDDVQATGAVKRQLAQVLLKRVAGELMEARS